MIQRSNFPLLLYSMFFVLFLYLLSYLYKVQLNVLLVLFIMLLFWCHCTVLRYSLKKHFAAENNIKLF